MFSDKNTGAIKLLNLLNDIKIKKMRDAFEQIEINYHY